MKNKDFKAQASKDESFWNEGSNFMVLKAILNCDELKLNKGYNSPDKIIGCDAIAVKDIYKNGLPFHYAQSISLRVRFGKIYWDMNFRNHISNPNSELNKYYSKYLNGSNYASTFIQFFGTENNKPKFAVKWSSDDIASYITDNLECMDDCFKSYYGNDRYDIPLSNVVNYNATIYDLDNGIDAVSYDFIKNKYEKS